MNLIKSIDFFDPSSVNERIHIIGCGSVGSTLAENLARFGLSKITLYDFDKVEAKNIANQMFFADDVGKLKVEAVKNMILRINNEIEESNIRIEPGGWIGQRLSGYVFLAVDNIKLRKNIVNKNINNKFIKAMFDFRTGLTDAQCFAADWNDEKMVKDFLNSMNFTHEEAVLETPTSACGTVLGVAPTVRNIVAYGTANFINFVKTKNIKKLIISDIFSFATEAF